MTRRLRIHFDSAEAFRLELERNIAKGGIFVPGGSGLELRELLEIELALEFAGERRSLEAEVVHIVPGAGVALQFRRPASDLREEFSALLYRAASDDAWTLPEEPIPLGSPSRQEPAPPGRVDTRGVERRRAPRAAARLPAQLDGANTRIQGVTRNLSKTGALISADASDLPPGKPVRVKLRHPDTGDPVEVKARVTRHIATEGTVAAVSVDFEADADQAPELDDLVRAAETAHERRGATGIAGRIEELGMANLIQMLGHSSPHGTLSARSGTEEGVIAFQAGTLRYVRLGATRGVKALARILQWTQGEFEFHAHVDPLEAEDEPIRLEGALLEATRRIDESTRAGTTRLDPKLRFGVDRDALAAVGEVAKVEQAVLDLAAAGFTVRRILDVIPEDDAQVSEALLALIERGVLTPAS